MKTRVAVKKISDKRLAQHGGRLPWSSIAKRGEKPKARNPEREAKRKVRQRAKHAAYMRSETRKVVDARAGGQCERSIERHEYHYTYTLVEPVRCENPATDHHHLTYARYGGRELPSDIMKLCKPCHDFFEAFRPTRRHGR